MAASPTGPAASAGRVVAATAMSPALWHRYTDTAPGAFDGIRVRIDCGEEDPFYAATRDYVRGFRVRPLVGSDPAAMMSGTGAGWLRRRCGSSRTHSRARRPSG
jgi:hypothetical protein